MVVLESASVGNQMNHKWCKKKKHMGNKQTVTGWKENMRVQWPNFIYIHNSYREI